MWFKRKEQKRVVRFIKQVELTTNGIETFYLTELNNVFVFNSVSYDQKLAESFFEKFIENGLQRTSKEILKSVEV